MAVARLEVNTLPSSNRSGRGRPYESITSRFALAELLLNKGALGP